MQTDKTVTERLDIVMNALRENANSFSGKIGVTRSTIAGAISRNKGVNTDLLQKISDTFPSISIDWLVTGRGSMFTNEQIEIDETKNVPYFLYKELKDENTEFIGEIARLKGLLTKNNIDFADAM